MKHIDKWLVAVLAMTLGACSSDVFSNLSSFTLLPKEGLFSGGERNIYAGTGRSLTAGPVTSDDLVSTDGQCALPPNVASAQVTEPSPSDTSTVPAGPVPVVRGGVALQMTECEVVNRAGPVEKIDMGTGDRGERSVTLTYLHGPWPGIYRFTDGRLASVERVAEPPVPKPQKPGKSAKVTKKKA